MDLTSRLSTDLADDAGVSPAALAQARSLVRIRGMRTGSAVRVYAALIADGVLPDDSLDEDALRLIYRRSIDPGEPVSVAEAARRYREAGDAVAYVEWARVPGDELAGVFDTITASTLLSALPGATRREALVNLVPDEYLAY